MAAAAPARSDDHDRVSTSVVDHLRELLESGKLGPGDRLPAERELAEVLGVGRNSIREALRELQSLGLVESRRGAGTFVRAADPSLLMAPFQAVISLSQAAVDDVMEFRLAFEPEVAAMAAANAEEEDVLDLGSALRRFNWAVESDAHPLDADIAFHEAVARCTKNPLVIAVQHALNQLFAELRTRLSANSYQPDDHAPRGHQALFGAIVAGDPNAARDVMRRHLEEVEESLAIWRGLDETE